MQTVRTMLTGRRRGRAAALLARAAVVAGCALLVCACSSPGQIAGVPSEPVDYRMRHPITLTESNRTFELFIGTNRATLTAVQRANLLAFAQSWRHEATGGVIIDLPIGSSNEHAAHDAMREIT